MSEWKDKGSGLVPLLVCRNELEAQTVRAVLEDAGVPAFVFEKGSLGIGLTHAASRLGGVQVQVPADRLEEARASLELVQVDAARIDWSNVDVGEPPAEVVRTLASRGSMSRIRRMVVTLGPIIGLVLLLISVIGAVIVFWI